MYHILFLADSKRKLLSYEDCSSEWMRFHIKQKRTTKEGVIAGMLLGIGFTVTYVIWFRFVDPTAAADQWLFGIISSEGIGTIGMVLNFIVAIIVSGFTPPPPLDVQNMVEDIRIPSGTRDAS